MEIDKGLTCYLLIPLFVEDLVFAHCKHLQDLSENREADEVNDLQSASQEFVYLVVGRHKADPRHISSLSSCVK